MPILVVQNKLIFWLDNNHHTFINQQNRNNRKVFIIVNWIWLVALYQLAVKMFYILLCFMSNIFVAMMAVGWFCWLEPHHLSPLYKWLRVPSLQPAMMSTASASALALSNRDNVGSFIFILFTSYTRSRFFPYDAEGLQKYVLNVNLILRPFHPQKIG